MSAKITNLMKADCIGEFSFETEELCPRCSLHLHENYDDVDAVCLCGDSDDRLYYHKRVVPWDTCKEIYKRMAKHEPILSDNFETALTALIEHHGADALTSLAEVMRHHDLTLFGDIDSFVSIRKGPDLEHIYEGQAIIADDIKPEK